MHAVLLCTDVGGGVAEVKAQPKSSGENSSKVS